MSTKRSQNKATEKLGLKYIQSVVEEHNCIFQAIDLENDQGNDCFIEFIDNNIATSFCVFAQIKSGKTYKDKSGYKIPADSDHLQYWINHILPIVGIVYDLEFNKAYWVNITEYLKVNPQVLLNKSHNIRIDKCNEFSAETFSYFKEHFIVYSLEYKNYENFGRSLEAFSEVANPDICYKGLKSLFANHRERQASWYYIVLNIANIKEKAILGNILGMLSNYLDNPTVLWKAKDYSHYQLSTIGVKVKEYINQLFTAETVRASLCFLKDGIVKGSFSYLVFLVLKEVRGIQDIVYELALAENLELDERNRLFWLYIHFDQYISGNKTISAIDDFLVRYPDNDEAFLFEGIKDTIVRDGYIQTG
ncbi:uncharacterized protein DUF4365 [Mucilaginibacter oryzae]|uniref:Uncharacterized protein DUF4365 n=1 Tax=Mucilaginibacter oryzae TaxID=468058 RepID=A0A316HIV4_9SPHI|nr:DUF4365 domain-containing protein [Mucilaginibacter oryzae]PWK80446.1 uncharacterized protein DUF4365 [Mucilaginibacter oryzae]